jgi:hypothetical protein
MNYTDYQDQADGFHEEHEHAAKCNHPECSHLEECSYALGPTKDSGKGTIWRGPKDVWDLTHAKYGFRLVKGFNLLLRSEQ